MGELALRTAGGTRLKPKETVKVSRLIKEHELDADEVIYEVTPQGMRKLDMDDTVEPGKEYGVVPANDAAGS